LIARRLTGTAAESWLRMQNSYDLQRLEAEMAEQLQHIPVTAVA
jgi:plasmid maintenance system antidote protein VapI